MLYKVGLKLSKKYHMLFAKQTSDNRTPNSESIQLQKINISFANILRNAKVLFKINISKYNRYFDKFTFISIANSGG